MTYLGPAGGLAEALGRALGILVITDVPLKRRACSGYGWQGARKLPPATEEREKAVLAGAEGRAPACCSSSAASTTWGRFLTEFQRRCTLLGTCRQVPTNKAFQTFFATFATSTSPPPTPSPSRLLLLDRRARRRRLRR